LKLNSQLIANLSKVLAWKTLKEIRGMHGHSTSEITREVYLHAITEDRLRAVERIESLTPGLHRNPMDSTSGYPKISDVVSN
jgi:hypothetical protein